jgi:transcriptional regulator with XRE-family HTH domain
VARALNRLGNSILALRRERNLTQEEAAENAKLDGKHWQDIERARTNPTVASLVGIARAFKVPLSELFKDHAEPTSPRRKSTGPRVRRSK